MSLILEALRKSEAERRRGQAPDLRTELPPVAPPRAHPFPSWSWAVFAVALLALAWLLLARPGPAPAVDPLPTPVDTAAQADSAADPARDAGPILPTPRIVIEPVPDAPPQDIAAAPRQDPAPAAPVAAPAIAGESRPVPAAAADGTIAPPIPPAPTAPTASTASPASPASTAPATTAPDARLLALSDLSTEERRQLPPLKLSMHMWSEEPTRRFVILDGQRLSEGDRAGPAVVDAIRRDDVVLAWNGMRIRLSLR